MQQIKFYYLLVLLLTNFGLIENRTLEKPLEKNNSYRTDTLVLAHVVFRHGDRTPDLNGLWRSNPYYNETFYEPHGYGQLTNEGKTKEYNLGRELRKRYGSFLGDTWNIKLYDAWSTNYNRTKMSTALVLAGLFPPNGSVLWQPDLLWQPAVFNYLPVSQDRELSSWACPTVLPLIFDNEKITKRLQAYDELMAALREGTGEDVDYITALDLYFAMAIQKELGFPLENWTQAIFPEPFKTYVVDFYYIETSTQELKTVIAGYFLKKIIKDTLNKINGTLNPQERKLFLYSGHELNIAAVLTSLEAFNLVDPPPYGSYLTFEIHNINGVYGLKMFYQNYETEEPHALTMTGCDEFCHIDQFIKLTASIIPNSDAECNGDQGIYSHGMFDQNCETEEPHALTLRVCDEFCQMDQFVKFAASLIPNSDVECNGHQCINSNPQNLAFI